MISSIESALVVDDDVLMREFVIETLRRSQIEVTEARDGREAKRLMEQRSFDIAFIDLKMPGMDGMQLLDYVHKSKIETLTVMMTAFGTVEEAVSAMKMGATDFLMKPFSPEQVELIIKRAKEWVALCAQNTYLQEELGWALPRGRRLLGQAESMQTLMRCVERVASSSSTVLISGESGTGKELAALAVHSLSERRDQPFIRMNCAAVPDALMDSELFGHEKGSFTSADNRRLGRFELAANGTLLMDEISEMKVELQSKLLRVLQEGEFERVGGNRTIRTNCRIIATTNREIEESVEKGEFRRDLYYRLNVLPLHMPALRERRDDIPLLTNTFLNRFAPEPKGSGSELHFSDAAMAKLVDYAWPGNVRELENLVERLTVMEGGPVLDVSALPASVCNGGAEPAESTSIGVSSVALPDVSSGNLAEIERHAILNAVKQTGGNRQQTADALGISVRTLRNKLNQYRSESDLAAA